MPKRVTKEKEKQIVKDYAAGFTKHEIMQRNHCSQRTLDRVRRKHGLGRRFSLSSLSAKKHTAVIKDYQRGIQVRDIMSKHNISQPAFYYILKMNDVPRRNWHLNNEGQKTSLRSREAKLNERAIVAAYEQGLSLQDIYLSWGATRADVSRCLRRVGLVPNRCLQKKQRDALYKMLKVEQRGRCAICGQKEGTENRRATRLALDHDHRTGIVRGLLCSLCNTSLGGFRDSEKLLQRAQEYLKDAHDKQTRKTNTRSRDNGKMS